MSLETGQRLGRYEVLSPLGEGGMGEVYRARDTELEREVAIKVLPESVSQDSERLSRFETEAKAVARLSHPNILDIYDYGREGDTAYSVTELLEGETLGERLEGGALGWRKSAEIGAAIADGLAAAHEAGIIHRDLKPSNIFLTVDGRVKILDFGLARHQKADAHEDETAAPTMTRHTDPGTVLGTVGYMSPEQVRGDAVDQRSDIFSLGCVLYEMIAGRKPFDRDTTPETMAAILKEEPTDLSDSVEILPPELAGNVRRCLEKQPQSRFQSASDLAYNLRSISSASTPSLGPSLRRNGTGRRVAAWAGVAGVIVVAAVALLMWSRQQTDSVDSPPDDLKRIVVLPFENLGPPEDEYFAAGMTEEITSRLAAVSGLRVISRTSAKAYAGTTKRIREIGQELDVGYVVEGTVRWDRDAAGLGRVRITPQLIRVADDSQLWSERYDRLLEDVFTIQSDIAAQVIESLQATLLEPERRAIEARPTENMEAYQAYLLALQYWWTGESESNANLMLELLKRAVGLDPEFAQAHALLSQAHSQYYHYKYDFTAERQSLARRSAERALELKPDLTEAHLALAFYHYWCHRDYDAALAEIAIAERAEPNNPNVLTIKWAVSRRMGRWQEALETAERATAIDPQGYLTLYEAGATLTMMRQFERADEYLQRSIAVAPERPDAYYYAVLNYLQWDGETARARNLLSDVPTIEEPRLVYLSLLLDIYDRDLGALLSGIAELEGNVISLVTSFHPKELLLCDALDRAGEHVRARPACESAIEFLQGELDRRPYDHRLYSALARAYVRLGRDQDAVAAAERAAEMWPVSKDAFEGSSAAIELAKIYARVGEHDRATDQIEELLSIPSNLTAGVLRLDPDWDPLRDHPRFTEILENYATGQ